MKQSTISKVMAELGRRGGKKTSKKKKEATKKSLAKARKAKQNKAEHADCTHARGYCVLGHGKDFKDRNKGFPLLRLK